MKRKSESTHRWKALFSILFLTTLIMGCSNPTVPKVNQIEISKVEESSADAQDPTTAIKKVIVFYDDDPAD
ncbi:MAG TPA: hypothetical protein DCK95_00965, partial [Anaerolineaceae bacterium]|nr:hypothetical protein [Anaerolineaceae bacterium]